MADDIMFDEKLAMRLAKHEKLTLVGRSRMFGYDIVRRFEALQRPLQKFLETNDLEALYGTLHCIRELKESVKDVHNFNHQLACLAAKAFLEERHPEVNWQEVDVLQQSVNSRGPDLRITQAKIICMVKTTEPSKANDFGAQQQNSIKADLDLLSSDQFDGYRRYMFVTSPKAHHVLQVKWRRRYGSVALVLLRNAHLQEVSEPNVM